jgi:ATP-binding cassette, subfamily C, bacterial CydD
VSNLAPQKWLILGRLLLQKPRRLALWVVATILLAFASAAVAFLVGPLLRIVFGGSSFKWSPLMTSFIGKPPSIEEVRFILPWLIGITSIIKACSYLVERISRAAITREIGRALRHQILHWGVDQHMNVGQGDFQHRLTVDVERFEVWLDQNGASLFRDGLNVCVLFISAIMLSGYIGILVLTLYPLLIIPILRLNKSLKQAARGNISTARELHIWAKYAEQHIELMRANDKTDRLHEGLNAYHSQLEKDQSKLAFLQGLAPSVTELGVSLLIAISLYGFTWGLDHNWWSAEELLSLFVCIIMLYQPVKSLGRAYQQWSYGQIVMERCLVNGSLTEVIHEDRKPLDTLILAVESIQRVETHLEMNINMTLETGHLYGIMGINGSGKSSLLMVIAGLLPYQGVIKFHGPQTDSLRREQVKLTWFDQPSKSLITDLESLVAQDHLAYALLEKFSFPIVHLKQLKKLIIENETDKPKMEIWDWFESLSLGEKQKLGLSLVLGDQTANLLLLDEPEAHLDRQSLYVLKQRLRVLSETNIVIIVSHDPSLIETCDQLIKL